MFVITVDNSFFNKQYVIQKSIWFDNFVLAFHEVENIVDCYEVN